MYAINLEPAIEVFMEGFCYGKSFTHPYGWDKVGRIWVMRDGPRKSGSYRLEEFVSYRVDAAEVLKAISHSKPKRYAIAVVLGLSEDREESKKAFKAHGLRMLGSEKFFALSSSAPDIESSVTVRRVMSREDAARVARSAQGHRQILESDLREDARLRLYAAFDGDTAVGWVRSIDCAYQANWVSNLYVLAEYRRRGLGRALMTHMLADDRKHGRKHSVLLASTAGSLLYPLLGYEEVGLVQIFMPK